MNIMHSKTVKLIVQLSHVMQWRMVQHSEVSKYQLISQPKLDKFQLQCYSKCSKWQPLVSTQLFVPLINSIVKIIWSVSLKPMFTWKHVIATRQWVVGAHWL